MNIKPSVLFIMGLSILAILLNISFTVGNFTIKNKHQQLSNIETPTIDSIQYCIINLGCKKRLAPAYAAAVDRESKYFDVDWKWLIAMITQESAWKSSSKSFVSTQFEGDAKKEYAWGLMMLKGSTAMECAKELGEPYSFYLLFDGPTNIHLGTYYLAKRIVAQGGDIENGIRAYNAGDGGLSAGLDSDKHYMAVVKFYNKVNEKLSCMNNY